MSYRVGIDVGGTFTDLVAIDEDSGERRVLKVPSDPERPDRAVIAAIEACGVEPGAIARLVHGSTVSTNAVLERKGATVGLLTTAGFEDVLEIGHIDRPHLYDLSWSKPAPLVPRRHRLGVPERLDHRGHELRPLDEDAVREGVARLVDAGVEAIAVCFLHAYANPVHELAAREVIVAGWPDLAVSISSEVMNAVREFERTSTVVVDAYVKPVMARYLRRLELALEAAGLRTGLDVMQSSGGVMTAHDCAQRPVHTLLSGPAGGVIAAIDAGAASGHLDLVTIDIGGTSADVALITDGAPSLATDTEVDWGIPVQVPMIDIRTIGAGGGSVAWIDKGGRLKVGPESAGARPGPACYGLGGTRATVTDANLLLGYLSPDAYAGGALQLDPALAEAAVAREVAGPLGIDTIEAARGIIRIVDANMRNLIRQITVQQGHDPRDYALMAYGGGGPVHAVSLARELGMRRVCIPEAPGVLSASGLLLAVPRHDFVQSLPRALHALEWSELDAVVSVLEQRGRARLQRGGIATAPRVEVSLDMQYERQNYTLTVPLTASVGSVPELRRAFTAAYDRAYGYHMDEQPIVIVNCRVSVIAESSLERPEPVPAPAPAGNARAVGSRLAWFDGWREARACATVRRSDLAPGMTLPVPCVIEQADTSVVIPPDVSAIVDAAGMIVIELDMALPGPARAKEGSDAAG